MANADSTSSPLQAAAGAAGPHLVKSFKLLSNEIRLAILLALWEAYEPHGQDNAVPFAELHDRVGTRDSGHFSYHLDKLLGHFVDKTPTGYELRNSGLKIVRGVIAGSGLEERDFSATEIPRSCYYCRGPVKLSYEDGRLYQICSECSGNIGPESTEESPRGTLVVYDDFNPAGLTDRRPEEVFVAGTIEYEQAIKLRIRGVCPECSGPIEQAVHVCPDHQVPSGDLCHTCGTVHEVRVSYVCSVCKHNGSYPAWMAVYDHPAVVSFYYDHGFDMTFGMEDPDACGRLWKHLKKDQTVVSKDPLRIRVTASIEGARLHLILDADLDVVDIVDDDAESKVAHPGAGMSGGDGGDRTRAQAGDVDVSDTAGLPDKGECLRALRQQRWPDGPVCPYCSSTDLIKKGTTGKGAQRYKCRDCERTFNDLTGTLFAGRNLTIPEMAYVIREMEGTETTRIARRLGRTYKSILYFVHAASDGGQWEVEALTEELTISVG